MKMDLFFGTIYIYWHRDIGLHNKWYCIVMMLKKKNKKKFVFQKLKVFEKKICIVCEIHNIHKGIISTCTYVWKVKLELFIFFYLYINLNHWTEKKIFLLYRKKKVCFVLFFFLFRILCNEK